MHRQNAFMACIVFLKCSSDSAPRVWQYAASSASSQKPGLGFRLLRRYFLSHLMASLPYHSDGTDKSRASIKLNIHHFLYQPYYKIFIFASVNCYFTISTASFVFASLLNPPIEQANAYSIRILCTPSRLTARWCTFAKCRSLYKYKSALNSSYTQKGARDFRPWLLIQVNLILQNRTV